MPLVFPGSNRKKGDAPPDPNELVFRDGRRTVPPYLVDLMSGIDTVRYTYDEAVQQVNQTMTRNYVNGIADNIVRTHLRGPER